MSKILNVRKPDAAYVKLQLELVNKQNEGAHGTYPIQQELERRFMAEFHLTLRGANKRTALERHLRRILPGVYDHATCYTYYGGPTLVAVCQPYQHITDDMRQWLNSIEAELIDLDSWAFYYPTSAICNGLVINARSYELVKAHNKVNDGSFWSDTAADIFN